MGLIKKLIRTNKRKRKLAARRAMPAVAAATALDWEEKGAVRNRAYTSYEMYTEHQKLKLGERDLSRYNPKLIDALTPRLQRLALKPASAVLCLGARSGAECEAFIRLGHFAIGIDLNPGEGNRYVVHGDFHHLQYADASIDAAYTNALDHAFQLDRILAELRRVLKPGGLFITDIIETSRREPGDFDATWWSSIDGLIGVIEQSGLKLVERNPIEFPWVGEQAVFRR
jgi:SAM-dependent methyltransferase